MLSYLDYKSVREASAWASSYLNRTITESNITYLIQYGKIRKFIVDGMVAIDVNELKKYYDSYHGKRELNWKEKLGSDLNWSLSFDHLREKDTTKHVHRLHPYKGKFIPQLVEYFLDSHVDSFKKSACFKPGDIILDPFVGSGTTLIQAHEMGMHAIGTDISQFNCMITDTKLTSYNFDDVENEINILKKALLDYEGDHNVKKFEQGLHTKLVEFNSKYFPSPKYKIEVQKGIISEMPYAKSKEKEFLSIYNDLIELYHIELNHFNPKSFLDTWYIKSVRDEIYYIFEKLRLIQNKSIKKLMAVILSRTIRSCRATTHSDLATLKSPQVSTYYCWKHKKICKPLFSIVTWFNRYSSDTLFRLKQFSKLKTDAHFQVFCGDSRNIDIASNLKKKSPNLYNLFEKHKIRGIFSSPPYVGQIDYHEQHAYAYDLFGFKRQDILEIGPLYKGQGLEARRSYIDGISQVLLNCKKYLCKNYDVFIVANDKYNLYPTIAEKAGMKIIHQYKRPVLNRTERDKIPYSEIIFHLINI